MSNNLAHDSVEDRVENLIKAPASKPIPGFFQCAECSICPNESNIIQPVFINGNELENHMRVKHGVLLNEDALKLLLKADYIKPVLRILQCSQSDIVPRKFEPLSSISNNPNFSTSMSTSSTIVMKSSLVPKAPDAETQSTSSTQAQNTEQVENQGSSGTHDSPKPETVTASSSKGRRRKRTPGAKPNDVANCRYCSTLIQPRYSQPTPENKIYPEACEHCSVKYPKLFITVVRSRYDNTYYKCSECKHRASTRNACMKHIIRHPDPKFRIRQSTMATIYFKNES